MKNLTYLLILCIHIQTSSLYSQNSNFRKLITVDSIRPVQPPISEEIVNLDQIAITKAENQYFYDKINLLTVPSTVSISSSGFRYFDYHKASNDDWTKKGYAVNGDFRSFIPIGGHWFRGWVIHLEPAVNVKVMFEDEDNNNDTSLPVRTPSYLYGASAFYTIIGKDRKNRNRICLFDTEKVISLYGKTRLYHHSNGQNATTQLDTTGILNFPNADRDFLEKEKGYINRFDGDFGINLLFEQGIGITTKELEMKDIGGYKYPLLIFPSTWITYLPKFKQYKYEHEFSAYLSFSTPVRYLGMTEQLKTNRYGKNRLNLHLSDIVSYSSYVKTTVNKKKYRITEFDQFEQFRFYYDLSYIMDRNLVSGPLGNEKEVGVFGKKRFNVSATAHWRIPKMRALTLFGQIGYYGSDPYNIYFQRSIRFYRIGFGFGFLKYPDLKYLETPVALE